MPDTAGHWNKVYRTGTETGRSWFEEVPQVSLDLIEEFVPRGEAVLDVGGGTSRLAEALLDRGYGPITVADLSHCALATARARMGPKGDAIAWVVRDVTDWRDPPAVGLWHDRALFHFLTEAADQARYLSTLSQALHPGGHAIIATFAKDGPESCAGMRIARYDPDDFAERIDALAPGLLAPVAQKRHVHVTPAGKRQSYQTSVFRRA